MNQSHVQSHALVVEALSGRAPRQVPPQVLYQEGHASQINPRRNLRSNFRDKSNRRKTTGFEEIRQEYYQLHHNKAREESEEPGTSGHQAQLVDDTQEFFPKPSAFLRAPRRPVPARRQRPSQMEDDELVGGPTNFRTRGSKAADMFQRRRERTDQFILDQENASPQPAAHQAPIQIQLTQNIPPKKQPPKPESHRQPQHPPAVALQNRPQQHHQQQYHQQQYHQQQPRQQPQYQHHQQHPQPQYQQPQHQQQQYPQQKYPQPQHQQQQHRQHRQQQPRHQQQGHTTVDSRRTRQPLAPKSPRFELNSPWNDRNMQVGKRFHPNVVPYQDNYNTSPRGWGSASSDFGEDNNVKQPYEFTDTSQKFQFTPAPRLNKFGTGIKTPLNDNYNSRPKSWCDIDLTAAQQPPPSRRAYPSAARQHSESSANQFAGQSGWGYGESDEL